MQKCGEKKALEKRNEPPLFPCNGQFAFKESDAMYVLAVEGHCALQTPFTKLDAERR